MVGKELAQDRETVAFDVEGTLTEGTAWEGIRDYLLENGEEAAYQRFRYRMTPRYVLYRLKLTDGQAFKEDWVAGMLELLAGHTEQELQALGRRIVDKILWPARRDDVLAALEEHKAAGRQVVLVSGQFEPFLSAFVEKVGADAGIGTKGVWQDGYFSGQVDRPFTTGARKAELLREALPEGTLFAAYGDTGPDEPLLAMSERPTAVYPDPALLRAAQNHNWRILD